MGYTSYMQERGEQGNYMLVRWEDNDTNNEDSVKDQESIECGAEGVQRRA